MSFVFIELHILTHKKTLDENLRLILSLLFKDTHSNYGTRNFIS